MSCPKILEIFWFVDGKLSKVQEANFQQHFESCEDCQELFSRVKRFYDGRMGMIIEGDKSACVSDGSLVRVIRMESTFEESRTVEEHLKKCKRCLKRFADFYTERLSQEEVLRKEEIEIKEKIAESGSSVYGDKMDQVQWWKGGYIIFLGVRFSKLTLAIAGGTFVFLALMGLVLLNFIFEQKGTHNQEDSEKTAKQQQTSSREKGKTSLERFLHPGEKQKKHQHQPLLLYSGVLSRVRKGHSELLSPGRHDLLSGDRFVLSDRQAVKLAISHMLCTVLGPADFLIKKQEGILSIVWRSGAVLFHGFAPEGSIEFSLPHSKGDWRIQVGRVLGILSATSEEKILLPLKGRIRYVESLRKRLTVLGKMYVLRGSEVVPIQMRRPPEVYFRFFQEPKQIFQDLSAIKIAGTGSLERNQQRERTILQIFANRPTGARAISSPFKLKPRHAYLIQWRYRMPHKLSKAKLFLILQVGEKQKPLWVQKLSKAELWREEQAIFFTKADLPLEGSKVFFQISFLGKGRIDLQELSLSLFSRPRKELYRLKGNPYFLQNLKLYSGVFRLSHKGLIAKGAFQKATAGLSHLPKTYFILELQAQWQRPWGIELDFVTEKENPHGQVLTFHPQLQRMEHRVYHKGVEQSVRELPLDADLPPYTLRLFCNGLSYFIEYNGKYLGEFKREGAEEPFIQLFVPRETKQRFQQFVIYQE